MIDAQITLTVRQIGNLNQQLEQARTNGHQTDILATQMAECEQHLIDLVAQAQELARLEKQGVETEPMLWQKEQTRGGLETRPLKMRD